MRCNRQGKEKAPKCLEQEAEINKDIGKQPVRKTNVQQKSDCPCVMMVKEEGGVWKIKALDLKHNHQLCPRERDQLFSGHKYMIDMEKGLIKTLNDNNIPTRKMVSILSYLRGGLIALPMKKKDISNYRTKLNREVKGSDMTKILDYFKKKQTEDTSFFYKFDLDEDKRVRNLFWIDCSAMKYYVDYGECVSFDTTYITNRYNLPFAPFVGITEHGQSCLFGCAFLHDETVDTFKWVFQTFLEAMGGKHPQTIIIDQDMAMKSAIEQVFINTKHRNCLFHIKIKCYNKNVKVFAANEGLYEDFEDTVNNSLTVEEFGKLWKRMSEERNLQGNNYFSKMWEMRKRCDIIVEIQHIIQEVNNIEFKSIKKMRKPWNMLSAQQTGKAQNDQQGNEGETIAGETRDPKTEIDDPKRIQRKGRAPKPMRMKTHIEDIKKKMVAEEMKKKKKTNDTDSAGSPVKPKRKKRKETSNISIDPEATEH
ncbi:protein FAR1-RELATED SEQUENCE 5-like [Miscanthus floridulus]|uniref:protein FAR1-RELATED SEQUENCE 5-like n=1 Tax=Miscanthus floridulus TaxID=154761 RepID=UPI003457ACA9